MDSFLTRAWNALTSKLGSLAAFIRPVAEELEVSIRTGDVAKAEAACNAWDGRAHEMRETLDAGDELVAHIRASIADGKLDAIEAARGLLKVERLLDEGEDVLTGRDEDDAPTEAP